MLSFDILLWSLNILLLSGCYPSLPNYYCYTAVCPLLSCFYPCYPAVILVFLVIRLLCLFSCYPVYRISVSYYLLAKNEFQQWVLRLGIFPNYALLRSWSFTKEVDGCGTPLVRCILCLALIGWATIENKVKETTLKISSGNYRDAALVLVHLKVAFNWNFPQIKGWPVNNIAHL